MITAVRDYFKGIIAAIDSDLTYDKLVFSNEDTADHNLDFTYKMVFGDMSINRQDTSMISLIPVTITIYRESNIDSLEEDFDDTYCKAIDITSRSMNQKLIDQADYIKGVVAESITPAPLLDNDNSMQFNLQFTITVTYKYTI